MNILAIGSHPDDIEIGCFATLAKHRMDGDSVFGVVITKGENGGDTDIRREEALEAAKVINMKLFFGNFPDGGVRENSELVTFLDNLVKENKIDVMYTHSPNDRHQDHRAVCRASLSVSRNVQEVYCYEAVSLVSSFTPQVFVDVTETFGQKISALRKFESQSERIFVDGMEGIAKFRASQARLAGRLVEAFEAYKILRNENSPKSLEIFDLRNQVKGYKKVLAEIENSETNNAALSSLIKETHERLQNSFSQDLVLNEKSNEVLSPEKNTARKELEELKKIKNEIFHNKKEMEDLRNEVKGYRKALLLKKEIQLYKEILEKVK